MIDTIVRWFTLTPERWEQLEAYECLQSIFERGKCDEGADVAPIIMDYYIGDSQTFFDMLGHVNAQMREMLKTAEWNLDSLSSPNRKYYDLFKSHVTHLGDLPYYWTCETSKKQMERIHTIVWEALDLKAISVDGGTSLDPQTIGYWGWWAYPYDDRATSAFYQRILEEKKKITEIRAKLPMTLLVFEALTRKTDLTAFHLSNPTPFLNPDPIHPPAAYVVTSVQRLRGLKKLTLGYCRLQDVHVRQMIDSCPLIEELDFSSNQLTSLAPFNLLPRLRMLDVGSYNVRSNRFPMEELAHLRQCQNLEVLSLQNSLVFNRGLVDALIEALAPLRKLRRLDVGGCVMNSSDVIKFSQFAYLKELRIGSYPGSNSLTSAVKELRDSRPDLQVEFYPLLSEAEREAEERREVRLARMH
ncbi:MAG: hypothetical protein KGJ02_01160 [Verrucomicrobiota bacterium]|nr:hypothetical protein [Verrucomicrobiota bacterium]